MTKKLHLPLVAFGLVAGLVISTALALRPHASRACVENATNQRLFFTVESRENDGRVADWLAPGKALCLPGSKRAVFTVFSSDQAEEGCPRLSGQTASDRLIHFTATDSCRWGSHGEPQ